MSSAVAGDVPTGEETADLETEPLDDSATFGVARALSPVADAGALLEDQSDLHWDESDFERMRNEGWKEPKHPRQEDHEDKP